MKTILTHFYNEEYILPWWLNHHKKYFDHGILIDYHSTDNSVDIIKEICPTWEVIKSKNTEFNAKNADDEVKYYESKITGWKIALNVTEFLYGDYSVLTEDLSPKQFMIPSLFFVDNPDEEFYPHYDIPLHKQIVTGLSNASIDNLYKRCFRSLHNFDVDYPLGRHFWPKNSTFGDTLGGLYRWREDGLSEDEHPLDAAKNSKFMIFYYGFAPNNEKTIERKLQIQYKIPKKDIEAGFGTHHLLNKEKLYNKWKNNYNDCVDLQDTISLYIDKEEVNNDWCKFRNVEFVTSDTTNIVSDLCKISLKYNSDKCPYIDLEKSISGHRHPYTPIYDSLFSNLRDKDINFVEIGIENNDSINIWREYFKSAKIYGLEFYEEKLNFAKSQNLKNVEYEFVNVYDEQSINKTFKNLNVKYDVIIDDSTHQFDDQIRIIKNTVDYLKPGGILVIEDIFRSENVHRYVYELFDYLKYFSSIKFIETEHEMKVSTGWDNDKLLIMVRNNLPFEFSKSHDFIKEEDIADIKMELYNKSNNSKVFIITPSRRPFNLTFIEETIPDECEWIVVFDKTVKNEHQIDKATIIKSDETGFWGNPNRNIGLEYIKNNLNPSDNDWVYILDDDNILHPEWWNHIRSHLNSNDTIITWGQIWATGEPRTEPTNEPKVAKIDTSQYMVRWSVAKDLRFENIYEADGIYAEEAAKRGTVKKLEEYLGYYNFLRSHKFGAAIRTNICMISMFKNESKGIRRMLESVWRHIDFYIFQDNGSTDGTPEIVEEFFKDKNIPGFIYKVEEGWVSFGWNRDHLLQTALRNDHGCDWIMKMDCDEYLEVDDDFDWSAFYDTNVQSFHVAAVNPGCIYYRAWIWNAKLPWKFKHDVAHECIYLDDGVTGEGFQITDLPRSLRMCGTNDGESYTVRTKYISDALKLEEKLISEDTMLTDRYHFWYIGKSYMDCFRGDFYPLGKHHSEEFARRAIFYFTQYVDVIHERGNRQRDINEMCYYATFCIGECYKYLGDIEKAIYYFKDAESFCPVRNEHLVHLAHTYNELGQYDKMLEVTTRLVDPERKLPFPHYYFLIDTNLYCDSGPIPQHLHNHALARINESTNNSTVGSFTIHAQTKPRLWIVDNFYDDPYAVRDFAMKQEFEENLDYYKGNRSKQQFIVPGTKEAFEKIIGKKITNWTETHGMCGRFQYCTAQDDLVYHCDGQTLAGMIYLTPDAPFSCGTSLFAHKDTKLRNENDFGNVDVFGQTGFYDRTKFELVDSAGNVFNRLVLFDAKCIHSANEYFGTNITNSRLFHLFFFD